jgi:DNA-3-methyladenine glycosylase II
MPVAPYDFALVLDYLRHAHWAILEHITVDTYQRALHLAGQDVLVRLQSDGTMDRPQLRMTLLGAVVDDAVVAAAASAVDRIFALAVDPAPFLAMAEADPVLSALVRPYPGLRPTIIASPYEALVWAVLGQQITVGFARTLKTRLVALAGRSMTIDGDTYALLPHPQDVAALDPATLRALQFSQQKAATIIGISAAIAAGELDLTTLATLPPEEAITRLTRYKGIGRWTAECVLMRGLGDRDTLPAGDIGLRAVIGRAYGLGRHATEAEVRADAEPWAGWRGWATFFWWLRAQTDRIAQQQGVPR